MWIPCLTIRENTERPVTITQGTNQLVGTDKEKIISAGLEALQGNGKAGIVPKYWDGKTSSRIVDVLFERVLTNRSGSHTSLTRIGNTPDTNGYAIRSHMILKHQLQLDGIECSRYNFAILPK